MPEIKIQHVVSCSSEDTLHKANNLLNPESFRKWKCADVGEKHASVILQLEKSTAIHSIDIGNESSAFVEVLVGHSTSDKPEDYQVILVTSSFMNPMESKNSSNPNRVRIFGADKLCKPTLGKQWDRVKIVCTQPFNKHISYGLSFIKLHSPPSESDATSPPSQKTFGKFALKEETPSKKLAAGSFFKERKKSREEPVPLKGAAAIRAASYEMETGSPVEASSRIREKEERKTPAKPSSSSSSLSSTRRESDIKPKPSETKQAKKRKLSQDETEGGAHSSKEQAKRKYVEEQKEQYYTEQQSSTVCIVQYSALQYSTVCTIQYSAVQNRTVCTAQYAQYCTAQTPKKKSDEIMKGVRFVLSGYQNPYRGELRDKAVRMGAKYEANWGPGCTHLICAFSNTPKYQQVRGKGKIVSKEWILDSYKKKFLQPWKRYKLSKDGDSSTSEEEEDEEEDSEEDTRPSGRGRTSPPLKETKHQTSRDEREEQSSKTSKSLETRKEKTVKQSPAKEKSSKQEEYAGSTDVESIGEGEKEEDVLASDADTEDELREQEENYMNDTVDFVVTESAWDRNFDEALKENRSLLFIRPKWLYDCNRTGEMVSHVDYAISKTD
ncbi:putative DNA repair protein [Apostichopus japonicus]|uniref:Putative DNA repair protein n=1 Tax=Stichopus japonicus TaxID=307972 RepID=A0A2G8K9R9_STIJA|nr:putative DNA repair protein [Apostichopus japonicus]